MHAAARAKMGMPPVDPFADPPIEATPAQGVGLPTQGAPVDKEPPMLCAPKIRIGAVLDQASDREVPPLDHAVLTEMRGRYRHELGMAPMECEEVTDEQLTALAQVTRAGGCPYADFGVWGPYGLRIAKKLRFTASFMDGTGMWRSKELPGPDSLGAWEQCWRVYRTAAIMAGIARPAVLDMYAARFRQRVQRYSWAWATACLADQRCRREWFEQERRRQESFHAANPELSALCTEMPWNSVFQAAAHAPEFWKDNLEEPAVLARVDGRGARDGGGRPRSRSPPARRAGGAAPAAPAPKGGGKARNGKGGKGRANGAQGDPDARQTDGRYFKNQQGLQLCFVWNRSPDGCSDRSCPAARAHACEWCRGNHRAIHCTVHPNWVPPAGGQHR